ncbi:hypothetical protein CS8_024520 [Cupriavidus sp. 8B]
MTMLCVTPVRVGNDLAVPMHPHGNVRGRIILGEHGRYQQVFDPSRLLRFEQSGAAAFELGRDVRKTRPRVWRGSVCATPPPGRENVDYIWTALRVVGGHICGSKGVDGCRVSETWKRQPSFVAM